MMDILAALPPLGGYASLLKAAFMVVLVTPLFMMLPWIYQDAGHVRGSRAGWSGMVMGIGAIGIAVWLVTPYYFIGLAVYLVLAAAPIAAYVVWRDGRVGPGEKFISVIRARGWMLKGKGAKIDIVHRVKIYDDRNRLIEPPDPVSASIPQCETYNRMQNFLADMLVKRASEADISPAREHAAAVRFVVDGVLSNQPSISMTDADMIIQYIKPMAGMDAEERRRPQEGLMSVDFAGKQIEIGVTTTGSTGGQRVQFRIMQEAVRTQIEELGMTGGVVAGLREMSHKDSGLIIVSGRVGSGVTSTLYSILRDQDAFIKQLVTLEAKTATDLENVTQNVYGDPKQLPKALTSVVRRDPDVIMVDKCPDPETAAIIMQTAESKLVLLGAGAVNTFDSLARWLKTCGDVAKGMANLHGVLCQVLIRNLCPACRKPYRPNPELLAKANLTAGQIERFYRPPEPGRVDDKGEPIICPACQETGYVGRTGVFELLEITDEIRQLVVGHASVAQIKAACRKNNMQYLQENALEKVIVGLTSIQEVIRVTQQGQKTQKKQ